MDVSYAAFLLRPLSSSPNSLSLWSSELNRPNGTPSSLIKSRAISRSLSSLRGSPHAHLSQSSSRMGSGAAVDCSYVGRARFFRVQQHDRIMVGCVKTAFRNRPGPDLASGFPVPSSPQTEKKNCRENSCVTRMGVTVLRDTHDSNNSVSTRPSSVENINQNSETHPGHVEGLRRFSSGILNTSLTPTAVLSFLLSGPGTWSPSQMGSVPF